MVGMALWAFFLGVLLHVAGRCNGGITSHFVRKEGEPVDMPFDSNVFQVPEGYNAPQQVVLFLLFFVMLVGYSSKCRLGLSVSSCSCYSQLYVGDRNE